MNVQWQTRRFDALEVRQLYQLLQLRQTIFVVEQTCIYQDLDDVDLEAVHLLGYERPSGRLWAYARCLPPGLKYPEPSIGRVAVEQSQRGKGLGHELVKRAIDSAYLIAGAPRERVAIRISAQAHLEHFYATHGFLAQGDYYLEDGIRHLEMLRPAVFPEPDKSK
jgi:ElaA protein